MHLNRIFTTCPYLTGSSEGVVCKAIVTLTRDIEDINPDNCICRHFELCHVYLSKLQEMSEVQVTMIN